MRWWARRVIWDWRRGASSPPSSSSTFDHTGLPVRQYDGADLYAFGSGGDPDDLFFTFFDSSLAAFGRLGDLKAMLDARQGSINALNSNSDFVNWQGELDGTAPQWGILNGKSAGNLAGLWLAPSGQKNVDLSSLGRNVRALLYRVQWDTGFSAQLFMVCNTPENAAGFATLIGLLQQASKQPSPSGGAALPPILQSIEAHRDGARLELDVSGPPELLDQILPQGGKLKRRCQVSGARCQAGFLTIGLGCQVKSTRPHPALGRNSETRYQVPSVSPGS